MALFKKYNPAFKIQRGMVGQLIFSVAAVVAAAAVIC